MKKIILSLCGIFFSTQTMALDIKINYLDIQKNINSKVEKDIKEHINPHIDHINIGSNENKILIVTSGNDNQKLFSEQYEAILRYDTKTHFIYFDKMSIINNNLTENKTNNIERVNYIKGIPLYEIDAKTLDTKNSIMKKISMDREGIIITF